MKNRKDIFAEIEAERTRQLRLGFTPSHDDTLTPAHWVALLCRHAGHAIDDGGDANDREDFRKQMVRVAAIAVAALEVLARDEDMRSREKPAGRPVEERGPEY